jgi:hypothetical protein
MLPARLLLLLLLLLLLCPVQSFLGFLSVRTSVISTAPSQTLSSVRTSYILVIISEVHVGIVVEEVGGQMVLTAEALHEAADAKVATYRSFAGPDAAPCHSRSITVDTWYRACVCVYDIVVVVCGEIDGEVRVVCGTLRGALSRHEDCRCCTPRRIPRKRPRAHNFDVVEIHGRRWTAS